MKGGTFKRITLKGAAAERSLLLSVVGLVEQDHGPLDGDGRKALGVRMAGRQFRASVTRRSITVEPM